MSTLTPNPIFPDPPEAPEASESPESPQGPETPETTDPTLFFRSYRDRRTILSIGLSVLAGTLTVIACVPLFSVLIVLIHHGGSRILNSGLQLITSLPPGAMSPTGGGFGNALVGTLTMVILAAAIAVPFGVLAAIFMAEYAPTNPAWPARHGCAAKVLTGLPSILAGVFVYAAVVAIMGGFSAFAGGIALSVLMIPIVMLTAEEAIRMVPPKMRHAAFGMGATKAQVVWKVVVPTAMPGILTGVMLAVARAAGETAPLIFTALASDYSYAIDGRVPFFHWAAPPPRWPCSSTTRPASLIRT